MLNADHPAESVSGNNSRSQLPRTQKAERRTPAAHNPTTKLTIALPLQLVNQLRDAAYWTPQTTLARLVEDAIRTTLKNMEIANQGPFPPREQELKAGRPRGMRRGEQAKALLLRELVSRPSSRNAHERLSISTAPFSGGEGIH